VVDLVAGASKRMSAGGIFVQWDGRGSQRVHTHAGPLSTPFVDLIGGIHAYNKFQVPGSVLFEQWLLVWF
jgi:hypothetical protein